MKFFKWYCNKLKINKVSHKSYKRNYVKFHRFKKRLLKSGCVINNDNNEVYYEKYLSSLNKNKNKNKKDNKRSYDRNRYMYGQKEINGSITECGYNKR